MGKRKVRLSNRQMAILSVAVQLIIIVLTMTCGNPDSHWICIICIVFILIIIYNYKKNTCEN